MTLPALNYHNSSENQAEIVTNIKLPKGSKNFTQILNESKNIIRAACGSIGVDLYLEMIGKSEVWDYKIPQICKGICCRNTAYKLIGKFKELGFTSYYQERNPNGTFGKGVYITSYRQEFKPPAKSPYPIKWDTATSSSNNIIFKNNSIKQQPTSNQIIAKPVPKKPVVVEESKEISKEEKPKPEASCIDRDPGNIEATRSVPPSPEKQAVRTGKPVKPAYSGPSPEQNSTIEFPSEKIRTVLDRVEPEKRRYVPIKTLQNFEHNFDTDRLSDIVIYAINNAKSSVANYLYRCLERNAEVDPQEYYSKEYEEYCVKWNEKEKVADNETCPEGYERQLQLPDIDSFKLSKEEFLKASPEEIERTLQPRKKYTYRKKEDPKRFEIDFGIKVENESHLEKAKQALKDRLPNHSYNMWIEPITFEDGKVYCPNNFARKRILLNYRDVFMKELEIINNI